MVDRIDHVADLASILDDRGIIASTDWGPFVSGWRWPGGTPLAVVAPATVDQLRNVVRYCVGAGLPIVPQGANTGLVGAAVPNADATAVMLLTQRINALRTFSVADAVVVAEAGMRLSTLNEVVGREKLQLGIDLGADPSVGGMVATNTGGSRMFRYGDVRRHLLGVELVLADADATLLSNLPLVRKDNSRLGWSQMVAGSGGALGIITAAAFTLDALPSQSATVMIGLADCAALPSVVTALRGALGEILSAIEGISAAALVATLEQHPQLRAPFAAVHPAYTLLVEVASVLTPDQLDVDALLLDAVHAVMAAAGDDVVDAVVMPPADAWALRHSISGSLQRRGEVVGLDISVPLLSFPAFRRDALALLGREFAWAQLCDFGHCGDGGVHFNVVLPSDVDEVRRRHARSAIRSAIYAMVVQLGGSFSAEHGLGPANHSAFRRHLSMKEQDLIHRLREVFDSQALVSQALPKRGQ